MFERVISTGHEWNPMKTLNIHPGQHIAKIVPGIWDMNHINPMDDKSTQVSRNDAMHLWVGGTRYVASHDSGSPLTFHTEDFRKQVDPKKVTFYGTKPMRVRGFFDTEGGPPPLARMLKLYKFKVQLVQNGKEYEIISHELKKHQSNCRTILIGRGSMAENGWEWRKDENEDYYVGTDTERAYTFDSDTYQIGRAHV